MKRVKRVEYERGWGWIARRKDGTEVWPDFRWSSRSVARAVVAETDMLERDDAGAGPGTPRCSCGFGTEGGRDG